MAKLYFKYGAMNCGKTTLLLQSMHNYEERGQKVFLLKPKKDTKGKDFIVSRIGLQRKVDYLLESKDSVLEVLKSNLSDVACIFVDEAQFLEKFQVDELLKITIDFEIPVICYGLRTDFKRNCFEGSKRLLEISHKIEEIKTICDCGNKAIFNARKVNGVFATFGDQVEIDNQKNIQYVSLCAKCYQKYVGENSGN